MIWGEILEAIVEGVVMSFGWRGFLVVSILVLIVCAVIYWA